ncbi:MAG: PEP-CTERM sorting domain-containing protein [Terriglobales bacterium]
MSTPESASWVLLAVGLLGLGIVTRRRPVRVS